VFVCSQFAKTWTSIGDELSVGRSVGVMAQAVDCGGAASNVNEDQLPKPSQRWN